MLLHLARAGTAAHADILQRAAKAGRFVPLKVVERNKDIRVHDRLADLRFFDVLCARQRDDLLVEALETVRNDDLAAGGRDGKAVFRGGVEVLQRVLPTAGIEGVAVGQERFAALGADHVRNRARKVRAQKGEVARLAKVDLDGDKAIRKIDILNASALDEPLELNGQRVIVIRSEVCKINF